VTSNSQLLRLTAITLEQTCARTSIDALATFNHGLRHSAMTGTLDHPDVLP